MIDRFLHGLAAKMEEPVDYQCLWVAMPGDMDPFDRHHRFGAPIDAELRLAGLGRCSGGGTLYTGVDFDSDEPSGDEAASTILDIDATEVDGARTLLRLHLPELGAPPDTLIRYGDRQDRFDGECWHLHEPASDEDDQEPWRGDKG